MIFVQNFLRIIILDLGSGALCFRNTDFNMVGSKLQ